LDDAERRVQNQFGVAEAAALPAVFQQRVHRMMEELEDHNECDGHEWRFRYGGGCCEECYDVLPTFLMVRSSLERRKCLLKFDYSVAGIARPWSVNGAQ